MVVNELNGEVELLVRSVLRDASLAFSFLVVRALPVDSSVGFPESVKEFDSVVDNLDISLPAWRELKARSDLLKRSALGFRD